MQPVWAEESRELQLCSQIADKDERLRCYDALSVEQDREGACKTEPEPIAKKEDTRPDLLNFRERWRFETKRKPFRLMPHKPSYILPVAYTNSPNEEVWLPIEPNVELDETEVKFQLSAKFKIWDDPFEDNGDLWFGYTQVAFWQLYNSDFSSPFRDTNYEPEVWFSFSTDWNVFGLTNRVLDVGFVHQSNGRAEPLSRSWDRVFLRFGLERNNFALVFQPWYWIPEDDPDDDNPDIDDFFGNFELRGIYRWRGHLFSAMLRNNLDTDDNNGAVQLDWAFPISGALQGYVQYFSGYGESLLDYNKDINRLGIGIMLADWL